MGNFMGFAYGMFVRSQENHSQPLTERDVILQARVGETQEDREPVHALSNLRESIARLVARTGQRLEQESQG